MTEAEQIADMKRLVRTILDKAETMHPLDFQVYFGAILCNVVGAIPEPYWRRTMQCKPCSIPDCNCHELDAVMMAALDLLRKDHMKTMAGVAKDN